MLFVANNLETFLDVFTNIFLLFDMISSNKCNEYVNYPLFLLYLYLNLTEYDVKSQIPRTNPL